MKATKKKYVKESQISVRIDRDVVEAVQKNKEKTFVPVGKFFGMAAMEKLQSQNKSK